MDVPQPGGSALKCLQWPNPPPHVWPISRAVIRCHRLHRDALGAEPGERAIEETPRIRPVGHSVAPRRGRATNGRPRRCAHAASGVRVARVSTAQDALANCRKRPVVSESLGAVAHRLGALVAHDRRTRGAGTSRRCTSSCRTCGPLAFGDRFSQGSRNRRLASQSPNSRGKTNESHCSARHNCAAHSGIGTRIRGLQRCDWKEPKRRSDGLPCLGERIGNPAFRPDTRLGTLRPTRRWIRRMRVPQSAATPVSVRPRMHRSPPRFPAGRPTGCPAAGAPALSPQCLWRPARRAGAASARYGGGQRRS